METIFKKIYPANRMMRFALQGSVALVLVFSLFLPTVTPVQAAIPTISIVSVNPGNTVTIQTDSFPASVDFTVRMGSVSDMAMGGEVVGTTNSGAGGTLTLTYTIPASLASSSQIGIRMDGGAGYSVYNWFYNAAWSGAGYSYGWPYPYGPAYWKVPTFSIQSVVQGGTVTIKANNFPASQDFKVRMGFYGTLGIGGIEVATTNSGSGGTFEATYNIPDPLKGLYQIAIRLESASGYYAYNWFYNNTTGVVVPPPPGSGTTPVAYWGWNVPTFSIVSVARDNTVTVQAYNLPPNQDFTVRMGPYGSLGLGGLEVASFNSGSGGSQSFTFNVPGPLYGSFQIAVRMDSNLGFYAYNWFYNNSTF
jgi:hypothetical protein